MADEDFGAAIRQSRKARGWTQQHLASQAGIGRATVSAVERGKDTSDAVKEQLRQALGLRATTTAAAAPSDPNSDRIYPGRAQLSELPFEWLSPEEFEEFTAALLQALHPGASVDRLGKSGHTQYGYDVHVTVSGKIVLAAQCKREKQFGPEKVREALKAVADPIAAGHADPVPASIIALSRIVSPDARKELAKAPGWEFWDRNGLSRKVRSLDLDRSVRIIRQFFPALLADFLGVKRPGPWLDAEEYLQAANSGKTLSHRWQLVGPRTSVDALTAFATGDGGRIALLTGPGGSGKTKVLTEVAAQAAQHGIAVRALETGGEPDAESFEQLPTTGPLLVIIDRADDPTIALAQIIAGVRKANLGTNILATSRPYGLARVREQLLHADGHISETLQVTMPELGLDAAEALARQVLDAPVRHHSPRLAIARDCPLLIVTGAALINRGELDPQSFENDERLHQELADLLGLALLAQSPADRPAHRQILTALAAYQPVNLQDAEATSSLCQLAGMDFEQLSPHITALEHAGVVLRRYSTVRVVPDLLGDMLLDQAARHRGAGVATGFLSRARAHAAGATLRHLIINVGRVDWQASGAGLAEPLWEEIDATFRNSDAIGRIGLLQLLAHVAVFQPRRALALAGWAVENPAAPASEPVGAGFTRTADNDDVLHALTPVLRPIAWHPEHFARAAELLWRLAQDDTRPPNRHPDHPLRALHELASFTPQGPNSKQHTLIGLVERWLARQPAAEPRRSPLTLLTPLLATSEATEQSTPDALVFHPFTLVPTPQIFALRTGVLDLAFAELDSDQPTRATAAIAAIEAAFILAPPAFGMRFDEELEQAWYAHFADVLQRLGQYLHGRQLAPMLAVAVRERLQWTAEYGPPQLRLAAQDIASQLPKTAVSELARALHGGPVDPMDTPDLDRREQLREALFADAAGGIANWSDEQAAAQISALLAEQRAVFGPDHNGHARAFVWDLITARPSLGPVLCAHAATDPTSPLTDLVSITLIAMGQAGESQTVALARQLAAGSIDLARHVAHAVGLQRGRTDLLPGEPELLRALASHHDSVVAGAAVGATRYLATGHPDLSIELLAAALPTAGLHETATTLGPHGALSFDQLPTQHQQAILQELTVCPSLDSYEIGQLLAHIAGSDPRAVVQVLCTRVETAEHQLPPGFAPLPHQWYTPMPFQTSPQYPDLLRQVREWLGAGPDSPWRTLLGGELFALVAREFNAEALEVIYEYIDTLDLAKIQVAAAMLRGAPPTLVWDVDAVRRILRAADRSGPDGLQAMQGALAIVASSSRLRRTLAGGPFRQDVALRDRALSQAAASTPGSVEAQFYQDLADIAAHSAVGWEAIREAVRPAGDNRDWG